MTLVRQGRRLAVVGMFTLALAGCGQTGTGSSTSKAPESKSPTHPTAATVYRDFVKAGLPASGLIVYTATTDPNSLLGRPNGYTSKCAWLDSRVPASDATAASSGDIGNGGGVEVFPTAAEATARAAYLFSIYKGAPILGSEYDYLTGPVLIRVSYYLTPAQAASYGTAAKATLYTG